MADITQHTAGPWAYPGMGQDEYGDFVTTIERTETPHFVARIVQGGARELAEAEANARLFAAAPEMLEALTLLADIADKSFAPSPAALEMGSKGWVEGQRLREAVDVARTAIAKARGEA